MLNAERFKKEINKYNNEFGLTDSIADCKTLECRNCRFSCLNNSDDEIIFCSTRKVKWLLSEYKEPIKLSKLEYDILNYLLNDTGYRYIVRDKYYHEGDIFYLYIFKNRPREDSGEWHSNDPYDRSQFYAFNNLFKFIKFEDEKPTSIQDVLNNCEVVNDAEE